MVIEIDLEWTGSGKRIGCPCGSLEFQVFLKYPEIKGDGFSKLAAMDIPPMIELHCMCGAIVPLARLPT